MTKQRRITLALVSIPLLASSVATAQSPAQEAMDRGASLYREGRFQDAAGAFTEAAELDPGSLEAWVSLGWAHRKAGRRDEAREVWARILKVDPSRTSLWNELASIDLEREDWLGAAASLERSLALDPEDGRARLRLAMALESASKLEEAAIVYEELVRREPESLTAILRLASFHERAGDEERALGVLGSAQARLPRFAHIFEIHRARLKARKADQAYAAGDLTAAVEAYQDAVKSNPRNARYLENLGWAHRRAGELAEAVEVWERARLRDPRDAGLLRNLADAERERGNLARAGELYLEAWKIAPGSDAAVPYRLAELALVESRTEDAVRWLEQLLELPDADGLWSERIAGLFARFETTGAGLALFHRREKVTRAPEKTAAALSRLYTLEGRLAREAADYDRAVERYREALRLQPNRREALRDLGWTQWILTDWEGCEASWTRLHSLDEGDVDSLNLLTHLYLYRRRYAEAADTASRSLALRPDQPEQALKLARALHWSERFAEAKSLAETLARDHPASPDIQRFWAEILMQYHDFERGVLAWQRVLELGGGDPRARFFHVKSLYELGHYQAALDEAKRTAASPAPHPGVLRLLADDALLRGEEGEAAGWLRRSTELAPDKIATWLEIAEIEVRRGAIDDAREILDEALRRNPGTTLELEIARANLMRKEGRAKEAYDAYRELARRYTESREVFSGLLQTASESERYRDALQILEANRGLFLKPYEVELERARLTFAMGEEAEARRRYRGAAEGAAASPVVPVLLYHGLGEHPRTPAMPLALFDSQMEALSRAGYTAVTVRELDGMVRGEADFPQWPKWPKWPPRPIVITFDDARIDSFELADKVLEKHGMRATMFVPTGLVVDGHPFFADWERLRRMSETGRWDLQGHGHRAHDLIPIDSQGAEGSFLVNRMWLAAEGRLETEEEYHLRLEEDYRRCKEEIESHIPQAEVVGYAFPFSEAGQENAGNAPDASKVNKAFLERHYRFGFIQDANGYNQIDTEASAFLRRFSVPRDFSGADLLRRLAREHPRSRALVELARVEAWTGLYGRSRETWEGLLRERPALEEAASYYLAWIDFQQGAYRAARARLELGRRSDAFVRPEEVKKLERRLAWEESFRIEPRFTFFEDSAERTHRAQALGFTSGSLSPIELRASFGTARFEDASSLVEALEADVGFRLHLPPHLRLDGRVRERDARGPEPDSVNYWASVALAGDRGELVLRGGREDVDTARARLEAIEASTYQIQNVLKLTPRFWVHLDGRRGEYSDGNEREDFTGRLTFRPWSAPAWRVGLAGGWTDSRFQSEAYYTPEELRFGRGLVSYGRAFPSGWSLDAGAELGWAEDELRGQRFTVHAHGNTTAAWSPRFRTSLGFGYSRSPGYRSWSLAFGMHFGLGGYPPADPSSWTGQ